MMREVPKADLLARLRVAETILLHRHGVRLRVDKVTANGRNAMCTAVQIERAILRSDLPAEGIVRVCHEALVLLYRVGLRPLVSVQPRGPATVFKPLDTNDPFQLRMALRAVDMEELLLPGFSLPSATRPQDGTSTGNDPLDDRAVA